MKIALISHLYPTKLHPYQGKFIQDQFELLNSTSGFDVDLIAPTPHSMPFTNRWKAGHSDLITSHSNGFRINYVSFPRKRFPKVIRHSISKNLVPFLKNQKYELVHIHWAYPDALAIPALKKAGLKTVLTIHGSDWYQTKDIPSLSSLIKASLFDADRILYSGPKLKKDIENVFPELKKKSDIIYNMVDTDSYHPISIDKTARLKEQLKWNPSKVHALTVANIRHEKGIDLLAETITKNKELADIQFHLIGNEEGSDFSAHVIRIIKDNPFQNIELMPAVPPKELINYYQASDFYILPSRREGFNVSILEAVACGLPLVCTDVGGNKEVIDKGTGIMAADLENHNATDLLKMSENFSGYDSNILNDIIRENYGKSTFINRLVSNYESALSN